MALYYEIRLYDSSTWKYEWNLFDSDILGYNNEPKRLAGSVTHTTWGAKIEAKHALEKPRKLKILF